MPSRVENLEALLREVRAYQVCAAHLPFPPKPILMAGRTARLMIVGQAPGRRVHETGIPWNDPSGDRLRDWMQVSRETFYDKSRIAIIPTGFCYPGTGKNGDLPPRPECAPLWHPRLRAALPGIRLTLLVGSYAQAYYLGKCGNNSSSNSRVRQGGDKRATKTVQPARLGARAEANEVLPMKWSWNKTLTETVRDYRDYLPEFLPLPHPSPRNQMWLKRNPWFAAEVLPLLRELVEQQLQIPCFLCADKDNFAGGSPAAGRGGAQRK